jgi:hypothetical protein
MDYEAYASNMEHRQGMQLMQEMGNEKLDIHIDSLICLASAGKLHCCHMYIHVAHLKWFQCK